jgi:transposase
MTYSRELREHMVKAKDDEGLTFEDIASCFHVSMRSLFPWQQRIELQTHHKKKSRIIDLEKRAKNVAEHPD